MRRTSGLYTERKKSGPRYVNVFFLHAVERTVGSLTTVVVILNDLEEKKIVKKGLLNIFVVYMYMYKYNYIRIFFFVEKYQYKGFFLTFLLQITFPNKKKTVWGVSFSC